MKREGQRREALNREPHTHIYTHTRTVKHAWLASLIRVAMVTRQLFLFKKKTCWRKQNKREKKITKKDAFAGISDSNSICDWNDDAQAESWGWVDWRTGAAPPNGRDGNNNINYGNHDNLSGWSPSCVVSECLSAKDFRTVLKVKMPTFF